MHTFFASRRWGLALLLAALLATYLVEIHHGLPNRDIVWGYDSNPLIPLIAAKKIFLDGWNTGWHTPYPNFHYYVLLLFLAPYMAIQWLFGNLAGLRMEGGYPYGLQNFDATFMHLAIITRLVSGAMAVGTAYWVYRIGRALHSNRAGLFGASIVGFSPAIVYYVHVETLDVPMLFWLSAALYCYVRALQTLEFRFYVWLAILAAVATATKDYAYGIFVLLPLPLLVTLARRSPSGVSPSSLLRSALDKRHMIALIVFLISFVIAENWPWNFNGFINHVRLAGGFVPDSGTVITTSFGRLDFFATERLDSMAHSMAFVLGWIGFAVCIGGLVYAAFQERRIALVLLWPAVSYYIFTVCQVLPAGSDIERPYMPLGMILAILGGLLLARAGASSMLLGKIFAMSALLGIALNGIAMDVALIADPRYQTEQWLKQNVARGATVEFYGNRSELPRLDARWRAVILNHGPSPFSDVQLTSETATPQALAIRNPEWLVVSDAYSDNYVLNQGPGLKGDLHTFFRRLRNGELRYSQAAQFVSSVSHALGFPSRLTPGITVFLRLDNSPQTMQ